MSAWQPLGLVWAGVGCEKAGAGMCFSPVTSKRLTFDDSPAAGKSEPVIVETHPAWQRVVTAARNH